MKAHTVYSGTGEVYWDSLSVSCGTCGAMWHEVPVKYDHAGINLQASSIRNLFQGNQKAIHSSNLNTSWDNLVRMGRQEKLLNGDADVPNPLPSATWEEEISRELDGITTALQDDAGDSRTRMPGILAGKLIWR